MTQALRQNVLLKIVKSQYALYIISRCYIMAVAYLEDGYVSGDCSHVRFISIYRTYTFTCRVPSCLLFVVITLRHI
uniref:Uncharacterized protein n=1 Tax=Siphoviridae sp. ctZd434 TaxID=2825559 RepID=A0A8S5UHC2_9CAUD|nr:MAG TPA: hypothetical protein [Siphoviridae sp. ctZd434]